MARVDPAALIAGFRGQFYWQTGEQMGECRSWEVIQNTTTTDESMLDEALSIPVFQGASFNLNFTTLVITDRLPMQMITALRDRRQLWLRFIGHIQADEMISRYVFDRVTPDGAQRLFQAAVGETMTRDFSWKMASLPDVATPLRTNSSGSA